MKKPININDFYNILLFQGSYECFCNPGFYNNSGVCSDVSADTCNNACTAAHSICSLEGECVCDLGKWMDN